MPDAGAHLWISQADSDRHAAARVYDSGDHRTFCQVIAKYQQIVEKIVKAVASAVRDAGIVSLPGMYSHDLTAMIDGLQRLPRTKVKLGIRDQINLVLDPFWIEEIKALMRLAPAGRPKGPGILHGRNTEYPFETAPGVWTAPALSASFEAKDVERFKRLAERMYVRSRPIISALSYSP